MRLGATPPRGEAGPDAPPRLCARSERGVQVLRLVTPEVKNAARKHFGCEALAGAELENGGGDGTALSHFEQRVGGPPAPGRAALARAAHCGSTACGSAAAAVCCAALPNPGLRSERIDTLWDEDRVVHFMQKRDTISAET